MRLIPMYQTLVMPLQNGTQKEPEREVWAPTFVGMTAEVPTFVGMTKKVNHREDKDSHSILFHFFPPSAPCSEVMLFISPLRQQGASAPCLLSGDGTKKNNEEERGF